MPERGRHCPFLNREDDRCAANFRVGRLTSAFDLCFGNYVACPTYLELLVERRVRQVTCGVAGDEVDTNAFRPTVALTVRGRVFRRAASRAA
jgi:hypothetical protein